MPEPKNNLTKRLRRFWIGGALDPSKTSTFNQVSLIAFFAWVALGSDGLSSSAYGPEEAFATLGSHSHLAIFVAVASALTVLVISASYMRIIEAFPAGGGGYLVASKLLSPFMGMVSGCALLIDYILTITISAAAAVDAVFSFLPPEWLHFKLDAAYLCLLIIITLNLRGAKGSVALMVPVFLVFLLAHGFAILYAVFTHLPDFGRIASDTAADVSATRHEMGLVGMTLLILRAYSMGAGTYTGIEAVSNGLPILREPRVRTAKRTMILMSASLAFMVFGLIVAYLLYKVRREPGRTLNATLLWTLSSGWPPGLSTAFVIVTLTAEALILFAAAQAGFLGGPRVLANMAVDRWFPTRFANLSDRLVTQNGVLIMGAAALATMLYTRGSVRHLVVLYSITVFIAFVLSQLGMVRHWLRKRERDQPWRSGLLVNGTGFLLSSSILLFVIYLKFDQGGWITLLATALMVGLCLLIRGHYRKVLKMLLRLDSLVKAARTARSQAERGEIQPLMPEGVRSDGPLGFDPKAKTAVLVVRGFNGLGLHALFAILRLFGNLFRNFVFIEVGVLDAGNYKGVDEVSRLQADVDKNLLEYVAFMRSHGYHAEGISVLSHDQVEGAVSVADRVRERFPQAMFFMGQLVFPQETIFTRLLHNNLVFALQRKLYHMGIPFIILPVRIQEGN
ncbi:MAG: putative rane protein [Fibrobacteres bacterium]|nr:putative rane protein [Fibrobacterota bacterium]